MKAIIKKISREDAIKILGRDYYLSGLARSTFHWTAYRENVDGQHVLFNSSELYKDIQNFK